MLGRGTYGTLRHQVVKGDNDGNVREVKEISKTTTLTIIGCRELQALIKLKQISSYILGSFHGHCL